MLRAMKLLIITYGTEGDTRPLAALGHALVQAGHDVELLGDARRRRLHDCTTAVRLVERYAVSR